MSYPFTDIHTHRCGIPHSLCAVRLRGLPVAEPPAPFSVGIHPWDAAATDDPVPLLDYLARAPLAAIGEIGLDALHGGPLQEQSPLFERQLEVAVARDLPVILHAVRCFEPVLAALKRCAVRRAVFHGFVGSIRQAQVAVKAGYCLSFGLRSFASPRTVQAMKATPPNALFFETDEAPVAIDEIYRRAARLLKTDPQTLAATTYPNFKNLIG